MNTKTLSTIIVFSAVTMALSMSGFAMPFFLASYLFFSIWEIPIVTAFVLISKKTGIFVSIFNAGILVIFFPGASIIGPFYNLIAILSMLFGIFLVQKSFKNKNFIKTEKIDKDYGRFAIFSTISGITFRVVIMTIVNYLFIRLPYPFGFGLDETAIILSLFPTGVFNAILAGYTITLGIIIAKAINKNLKLK